MADLVPEDAGDPKTRTAHAPPGDAPVSEAAHARSARLAGFVHRAAERALGVAVKAALVSGAAGLAATAAWAVLRQAAQRPAATPNVIRHRDAAAGFGLGMAAVWVASVSSAALACRLHKLAAQRLAPAAPDGTPRPELSNA